MGWFGPGQKCGKEQPRAKPQQSVVVSIPNQVRQQFLYLRPLPHGQDAMGSVFGPWRRTGCRDAKIRIPAALSTESSSASSAQDVTDRRRFPSIL